MSEDLIESMQENIMYLEMQVAILMSIMRRKGMIDNDIDRALDESLLTIIELKKRRLKEACE